MRTLFWGAGESERRADPRPLLERGLSGCEWPGSEISRCGGVATWGEPGELRPLEGAASAAMCDVLRTPSNLPRISPGKTAKRKISTAAIVIRTRTRATLQQRSADRHSHLQTLSAQTAESVMKGGWAARDFNCCCCTAATIATVFPHFYDVVCLTTSTCWRHPLILAVAALSWISTLWTRQGLLPRSVAVREPHWFRWMRMLPYLRPARFEIPHPVAARRDNAEQRSHPEGKCNFGSVPAQTRDGVSLVIGLLWG